MPLNSYVTLGRSGLRVSPFCLGAMTFGEDWGWGATPEDSSKILGAFLERGGNFVDTANFYTKGHSEKVNLAALDLPLSTDHIERLDKLSEPKLNFPAQYMKIAPNFSNAGATVNGIESTVMPFAPKDLEDHY
jgi:predicted oxidoreductase